MAQRRTIAIDPGERLLRAVEVRFDRAAIAVTRAIAVPAPADLDHENVEAVGRWIADAMKRGGFATSGEVLVVLARELATVRRIELPTDDEAELPEMARLAAQRDTPSEAGPLVVDVIPREALDVSMMALATAVPERAVSRVLRIMSAAGFKPTHCSLRTFGTARLLRDVERDGTATVGIDCSGDGVELVVVRDGDIRFSRGVRIADEGGADALAVEAKRSWTSWRLGQPEETVGAAVLFGDAVARSAAAEALGKVLGAPVTRFEPPTSIKVEVSADRKALDVVWPLVGLLLESGDGEETINLAAPRKAPDLAARRRSRILIGCGAVTLSALVGWTLGRQSWKSFVSSVEATKEEASAALPIHLRFKRDLARLTHLKTWESTRPEWLEHLRFLNGFSGDTTKVVLDNWSGTLEASDVQLSREGKWTVNHDIKIVLEGEAKDRTVADGLRDSLVDDARYALTSTGPDTEGGRRLRSPFSYVLRSNDPKAPSPRAEKPDATVRKPAGGVP